MVRRKIGKREHFHPEAPYWRLWEAGFRTCFLTRSSAAWASHLDVNAAQAEQLNGSGRTRATTSLNGQPAPRDLPVGYAPKTA